MYVVVLLPMHVDMYSFSFLFCVCYCFFSLKPFLHNFIIVYQVIKTWYSLLDNIMVLDNIMECMMILKLFFCI
jgi:hypothetical protein